MKGTRLACAAGLAGILTVLAVLTPAAGEEQDESRPAKKAKAPQKKARPGKKAARQAAEPVLGAAAEGQLLVPLALQSVANARVAGEGAEPGKAPALWAESLPQGSKQIDGVPFVFLDKAELHALDVCPSMRGWTESPVKLKFTYLGAVSPNVPQPSYGRVKFKIPGDNYSAMHLIAFSAERPETVGRMTVRVGYFGRASAQMEDTVVTVPGLGGGEAAHVVSRVPVQLADGKKGFLHHLRVPMHVTANVTQYETFDVEFTRDVNVHLSVPEPDEFTLLPAGKPSGAIVLAVTMERSPVQMSYTTAEHGNIFAEDQRVVFQVRLTNRGDKPVGGLAYAECRGPGTGAEVDVQAKSWRVQSVFRLAPGASQTVPLDVTGDRRGWYACTVGIEANGTVLGARRTSFAVLAPDTRHALGDSPFGIWCFWDGHTSTQDADRVEKLASIIHKGGWRWTYGGKPHQGRTGYAPAEAYRRLKSQYKLTFNCQYPPLAKRGGPAGFRGAYYEPKLFAEQVVPWLAMAGESGFDPHYIVIHESRASLAQLRRFSENLGNTPYVYTQQETARLQEQFEQAKKFCAALRQADADARIVLINDYPAYVTEYLKRGFPKDLFDVIGLEGAMFARQPERQPDWLCLLGHMADIKAAQKRYGYEDKPVWFTEALYHGTNPGNLSLHDQACICVREAILALALGIQRLAMTNVLADCTDDYGWSHWGSSGLCFRDPEYNPKPSYAMYAWLTQVLDQARYAGKVDSDSTVLHVLKFKKPDGSCVCPVWVVRGRQDVTLATDPAGGVPSVHDAYGNQIGARVRGRNIAIQAGDAPVYVVGPAVTKVISRRWVEVEPPGGGEVVLDFDDPKQLKAVAFRSAVLEGNWDTPRMIGNFQADFVTEDGATALRVELSDDRDERKLLPRYVQFALAEPIELAGRPYCFAVRVKGNGGWGRVMFELLDAKGRVWTSCGNQSSGAVNSQDCHGDSFISFDGWHTIRFPLPGQYAGGDQYVHWPRKYEWWPTSTPEQAAKAKARAEALAKADAEGRELTRQEQRAIADIGDEPVDYPVKLTKIIVTMRPHILYVDGEVPVGRPVVFLDRIGVVPPPEGM